MEGTNIGYTVLRNFLNGNTARKLKKHNVIIKLIDLQIKKNLEHKHRK